MIKKISDKVNMSEENQNHIENNNNTTQYREKSNDYAT